MRLIDADDLTINLPDTLSGKQLTQVFIMVKESFDKLPTVEAIPIEWLKEQAEDTPYEHRVDGLIERWRREHE